MQSKYYNSFCANYFFNGATHSLSILSLKWKWKKFRYPNKFWLCFFFLFFGWFKFFKLSMRWNWVKQSTKEIQNTATALMRQSEYSTVLNSLIKDFDDDFTPLFFLAIIHCGKVVILKFKSISGMANAVQALIVNFAMAIHT